MVVGDFNGNANAPDFAVLSGMKGSADSLSRFSATRPSPGGTLTFNFVNPVDLGRGGAVGIASGFLTGSAVLQ